MVFKASLVAVPAFIRVDPVSTGPDQELNAMGDSLWRGHLTAGEQASYRCLWQGCGPGQGTADVWRGTASGNAQDSILGA